jgi:hypothetical protein
MMQIADDHRPGCQLNPCSCRESAERAKLLHRLDRALARRRETILAYYELLRGKGLEADVRQAAFAAREADIELTMATAAMTEAAL